jgi:hypothetical protein
MLTPDINAIILKVWISGLLSPVPNVQSQTMGIADGISGIVHP